MLPLVDEGDPGGVDRVRARVAMSAQCYPGVAATVGEPGSVSAEQAGRARLVFTGVDPDHPARPWRAEVWAGARGPVAMVPMAA